jgi:hypothetical protein
METQKVRMTLDWLSRASAGMLIGLLDEERYVSWFYRSEHNPKGIGSSKTVIRVRDILVKMKLIEQEPADARLRLNLHLTEMGRVVAEHLKVIEDLLQTP